MSDVIGISHFNTTYNVSFIYIHNTSLISYLTTHINIRYLYNVYIVGDPKKFSILDIVLLWGETERERENLFASFLLQGQW